MSKMKTKIVGKAKKGYRRGGVSHDRKWKEMELSDEQIQAIKDDPRLVIEKTEKKPEPSKPKPVTKPEPETPPPRRRKKAQQDIPE